MYCEVLFKKGDSRYSRHLDLNYCSESAAKEALCRQSRDYQDVIILSVRLA